MLLLKFIIDFLLEYISIVNLFTRCNIIYFFTTQINLLILFFDLKIFFITLSKISLISF